MAKKLKKLAPGIYEDQYSIRAIVNIAAGRKEKRFDFGTSLLEIRRWRNETKTKLERMNPQRRAGVIPRGTFSSEMKRHLKTLTISSWKSRRSELRAWEKQFGTVRRRNVTTDHVKRALKAWVDAGVPAKTIQNRVRALTAMYHDLDGRDAWTPADGVAYPKPSRRLPDYVPPQTIVAVEQNLRAKEDAGTLDPKWRARYMVLNACGARPVHVKRATKTDVDLKQRVWNITSAKGGEPIRFPLNDDQVAAWTRFIAVNAWGDWDDKEYATIIRAAGWPAHIRPYNAKHSFGQDLADAGIDRETIADLYGHTDTKTTRIYVPRSKLERAIAAVNGRLGWGSGSERATTNVGSSQDEPTKEQIAQALEVLRKVAQRP